MSNSSSSINISLHELHQYELSGRAVVSYLSFLLLLGVLGNIHALLVYGRTKMTSKYQIFIVMLALNDLLACILSIPFEIVTIRYKYTFGNGAACKVFRFFYFTFILSSGLLLSLTAVERFQRIYSPFGWQMTRRAVYIACAAVFAASCLLSIPVLVFYNIVPKEIAETSLIDGTKCGVWSDTFKSVHFILLFLLSTGMLIIVVGAYSVIARVIFRQRQLINRIVSSPADSTSKRQQEASMVIDRQIMDDKSSNNSLDSRSSRLHKLSISVPATIPNTNSMNRKRGSERAIRNTITLMAVSVFSYIGILPIIILSIIKIADEKSYDKVEDTLGIAGSNILMRGYFINNVVNPFVYLFTDKQFRDGIKAMYLCFDCSFIKHRFQG